MPVNKVQFGENTLIDISDSTVTADSLLEGKKAYAADGSAIIGTAVQKTTKTVIQKIEAKINAAVPIFGDYAYHRWFSDPIELPYSLPLDKLQSSNTFVSFNWASGNEVSLPVLKASTTVQNQTVKFEAVISGVQFRETNGKIVVYPLVDSYRMSDVNYGSTDMMDVITVSIGTPVTFYILTIMDDGIDVQAAIDAAFAEVSNASY